jgi:cytochrome b
VAGEGQRQFVWDWPTRIFHWLLVLLIAFAWYTAEVDRNMDWHLRAGMAVLLLLVFRILWGLIGTSTARFSQFVRGPRAVWSYIRPGSDAPVAVGHNPIGGWSVIVMLLLTVIVVVAGLFAVDIDGIDSGPLSHLVSFDQGRSASEIHELAFNLLLAVIAIHILAIIFYLVVKRRNLVGPMVTGFQRISDASPAPSAIRVAWWRLILALAVALLVAYGVWDGFRF